jgi:outer membrane protein
MRKSLLTVSLLAAALASPLALAHKEGDFIVRAGAAMLWIHDSRQRRCYRYKRAMGSETTPLSVGVNSDTQLGLTFAYMLQDHLGLELLAATPFNHDLTLKGPGGSTDLGSIKHLPPTLSLQYFPLAPSSKFQPYVGLGVNYTVFFDEELDSQWNGTFRDLDLDSSWGMAGQLGMDYMLTDNILLNAAVWYIDIDTTATIDVVGAPVQLEVDVDIDPWVYMAGVGYKF